MKNYVVFCTPDPASGAPTKLWYIDGHTWEDDKTKATRFTREEAMDLLTGHEEWQFEEA